ncbi:MAG: SBBP repeat-containing protein [candidate division WOR-3 bacterium]|nr:MAG: SBBP repeat-containing protein [candidate division WOR-3 bacterium]
MKKYICEFYISFLIILPTISLGQGWVTRYNGPGNADDIAYALTIDDAGNVYVTGWSWGSTGGYAYATIKYDSSGTEQWVARYSGPAAEGNNWDYAYALTVDNAGNVYVTGWSEGPGSGDDYATVKYDSLGTEQWVARYNGPVNGDDGAYALAIDDAGNVYVTGQSRGSGTTWDFATVKYDSSGTEQWVARYDGPTSSWDQAYAIAVDDAGNVYVTGWSEGSGTGYDYATVKYDSLGVEQWVARYDGSASGVDWACALTVDGAVNVYVTGWSWGSGSGDDYATVMYDSLGDEQWSTRYYGLGNDMDRARAIAVDNAGNVYVTGESWGAGTEYDYATVRYIFTGAERWVARYDGPDSGWDYAHALAVDDVGNVYVTGESWGAGTGLDYATVQYDSSGVEQWVARYDGPDNDDDVAYALAIDNGGNVYVTGRSDGIGTGKDYATIKYSSVGIEEDAGFVIHDTRYHLRIYPNPFRHNTTIRYTIQDAGYTIEEITLSIYDATGRLVKDLRPTPYSLRPTQISWDGTDQANRQLPNGVYFLRFAVSPVGTTGSGGEAGDYKETKKLLLIR